MFSSDNHTFSFNQFQHPLTWLSTDYVTFSCSTYLVVLHLILKCLTQLVFFSHGLQLTRAFKISFFLHGIFGFFFPESSLVSLGISKHSHSTIFSTQLTSYRFHMTFNCWTHFISFSRNSQPACSIQGFGLCTCEQIFEQKVFINQMLKLN